MGMSSRQHGMRNDGWGAPQGHYAMYAPPNYMAVPWVPGAYPQAYPGYGMEQGYQVPYDPSYMSGYPPAANGAPAAIVSAPSSPAQAGFGAPSFAVVSGAWDPASGPQGGGSIAVPMSPNGMNGMNGFEYSGPLTPVVMVPASPQHLAQVQSDVFFDQLPSPSHKYADAAIDGTQTPEIGSDPGEGLHESLLSIYAPPDVA